MDIVVFVICLIVRKHGLLTVVLISTVFFLDGQTVGERILRICTVICFVVDLFITDLLQVAVLCGINGQPSTVECFVCLCFRITFFIDQCLDHLICQRIYKIGSDVIIGNLKVGNLDPVIDLILHGFVIFLLRDVFLI